jgi:hydroxyethylthiazole kinase
LVSELLAYAPTVIRGNASEIMAVAKASTAKTKGVDSTAASTEAIDAARYLQQTYGCVVCISGATDIIVSGNGILYLHNGDALMTKITGMGCTATALIAAFLVVTPNVTDAVAAAMSLLAISGELSAKESKGPGSLQLNILDMLHTITKAQFKATVRYETA